MQYAINEYKYLYKSYYSANASVIFKRTEFKYSACVIFNKMQFTEYNGSLIKKIPGDFVNLKRKHLKNTQIGLHKRYEIKWKGELLES